MALGARGLSEEEAAAYAYFGKTTAHGEPQAVPRYSALTAEEFERLALAGRPFVLTDGGQGQPLVGWTCDRFRQEYPEGLVELQYAGRRASRRSMKEKWEDELSPLARSEADGPRYAPWYWGVKGASDPEGLSEVSSGGANPLPRVQKLMRMPPFMRDNAENRREVFTSPEFWFSAPAAGAIMHMDQHCESTLAIQLSGTRRWRLGWAPSVRNGTMYKASVYGDGRLHGKQYVPPFEAIVSEGEALFMPSGFLHETTNIGDTCAASLTFQFRDPAPGGYFRQALRHLRRTADFEECWDLLSEIANPEDWSVHATTEAIDRVMQDLDKDGDGLWAFEEADGLRQRSSHAFHDVDANGFVSAAEMEAGVRAWKAAEVEANSQDIKFVRPRSFEYVARQQEL